MPSVPPFNRRTTRPFRSEWRQSPKKTLRPPPNRAETRLMVAADARSHLDKRQDSSRRRRPAPLAIPAYLVIVRAETWSSRFDPFLEAVPATDGGRRGGRGCAGAFRLRSARRSVAAPQPERPEAGGDEWRGASKERLLAWRRLQQRKSHPGRKAAARAVRARPGAQLTS